MAANIIIFFIGFARSLFGDAVYSQVSNLVRSGIFRSAFKGLSACPDSNRDAYRKKQKNGPKCQIVHTRNQLNNRTENHFIKFSSNPLHLTQIPSEKYES